MYDPFNRVLLGEYLDCKDDRMPISYDSQDFHFQKDWYDQGHSVTLSCMQEEMAEVLWAADFGRFNSDVNLRKKLEVLTDY